MEGKNMTQEEALQRLGDYEIVYRHDDGDLTVRVAGESYVVTTEGQTFKEVKMSLTEQEIKEIAIRVADEVTARMTDEEIAKFGLGEAMGAGAIVLPGRETRREPCRCCLIDPAGANAPENRMCTTTGAIGTLNDREERELCSEVLIVGDGRCGRARGIREAARECKERHPTDVEAFFSCYVPAFSRITK